MKCSRKIIIASSFLVVGMSANIQAESARRVRLPKLNLGKLFEKLRPGSEPATVVAQKTPAGLSINDLATKMTLQAEVEQSTGLIAQPGEEILQLSGSTVNKIAGRRLTSLEGLNSVSILSAAKVTTLYLNGNNITSIPAGAFKQFRSLTNVILSGNQNLGQASISADIFPATVKGLYMSNCGLTDIPQDLASLSQLETLAVNDNPALGKTLTSVAVLPKSLKNLYAVDCGISLQQAAKLQAEAKALGMKLIVTTKKSKNSSQHKQAEAAQVAAAKVTAAKVGKKN